MSASLPLPAAPSEAVRLAAAAARPGTPGHFDELRGAADRNGALSPVWQRFFEANGLDGWKDLPARRARVQRRVAEDGATYNVHAQGQDSARAWPLELLPMIVGAREWPGIEHGVLQRARLLEAALQDILGPQRLIAEGLLPSSLIHGHPQYLRPMLGVTPPGGHGLHVIAVDLARDPSGDWWVVGQRTQAPSGLGYLLENRLIVSQQFPDAFRALRVQRLASTFRALVDGLARASGAGPQARLALLTPGPHNETYFEHVFLARYLGLTLVEGSDLTVRDERVYLRTLQGLERVHVLLRRLDDEWLDPLELRAESTLGVPGLLQAIRAGQVVVANLPGAGVLESPGLTAFWPAVAQRLLGEPLSLPATTSWWCGERSVWADHRRALERFVIVPTFPAGEVTQDFEPVVAGALTPAQLVEWRARIDADPEAYTLTAPVRPSEVPVWRDGRLEPRPMVLRVYALRDGDGAWRVLPGGLARVAASRPVQAELTLGAARPATGADVYLSMQRGSASGSVDTWVLTDGEVDPTTLLPRPLQADDLAGQRRVITGRAAENLFWLGRYTERTENAILLARLALDALTGAAPTVLAVLQNLLLRHGLIGPEVPSPALGGAQATRVFERALVRALGDANHGGGIAFDLRALRGCAHGLRERLSPEHWTLIVELEAGFARRMQRIRSSRGHEPLSDVLAVLRWAATRMSAITGAQTDRMTRDDGWRLLSVGRQIERLDTLSGALAAGFRAGLHREDEGFALLLAIFDSTITYRAQYQARREVPALLHLLVLDTDNPRALGWVARTMRERLAKLARHDPAWVEAVGAQLPSPQDWSLAALCETDAGGEHTMLVDALDGCSRAALWLSNEIGRHLFSHVGAIDRTVWQ